MADAYLSRFKMTLETLCGAQRFTPSIYSEVFKRIEGISVGAAFLVFGFDVDGLNHIFRIDDDARTQSLDIEGLGTVGTGSWIEHASLLSRPLRLSEPDLLLYRVCEAKFASESVPTVGRSTVLTHFKRPAEPNGFAKDFYVLSEDIEAIRRIWEREQAKRTPFNTIIKLRGALDRALEPLQVMRSIEKEEDEQ